jgi:hypothetical protein
MVKNRILAQFENTLSPFKACWTFPEFNVHGEFPQFDNFSTGVGLRAYYVKNDSNILPTLFSLSEIAWEIIIAQTRMSHTESAFLSQTDSYLWRGSAVVGGWIYYVFVVDIEILRDSNIKSVINICDIPSTIAILIVDLNAIVRKLSTMMIK